MPAWLCCLGNGVMEILGVDPLVLDFDEDEDVAFVSDDKNEELAAAAAAGFNIASFWALKWFSKRLICVKIY